MFTTLLTPLRNKFDLSPRTPNIPVPPVQDDDPSPEDFARDVLIELMRNSVHNLTEAETLKARTEVSVLLEIHRIMLQEGSTKDVFRELDGFLVLMSALAAMGTPTTPGPVVEPPEQVLADTLECTRLAFMVISEAMYLHSENADYFNVSVGYDSLSSALAPLVSDSRTADETLGYLLSLSLNDFSFSDVFVAFRRANAAELDSKVAEFQTRLSTIIRPGAIYILWRYLPEVTSTNSSMYYATLKLFDTLSALNHRNQVVLSTVDFVSALVERFCEVKGEENKKPRAIVQKLLRRFLDMGATTAEARTILQRAVKVDGTLDMEIMELIRGAMKSRWLDHLSLESPAMLSLTQDGMKGLPATGFTFMIWLWIEKLPPEDCSHQIFVARSGEKKDMVVLKLQHDGKLLFQTSGNSSAVIFNKVNISRGRWIHLTLVHYPGRDRSSNPNIRLFVDGVLNDHVNWYYPKPDSSSSSIRFIIGDDTKDSELSWCIASSYLLSLPIADDLPRFIHHLGPRYVGNFQDPALVRFLTYEASTSLNMFVSTVTASSTGTSATSLTIAKVVRDGLGIPESNIIFALSPLTSSTSGPVTSVSVNGGKIGSAPKEFTVSGDVYMVKVECLDMALWKIGGIAVALRLVQVANTPHETSRSLSVLTDGLKNSWQNSEDMERLRGYEILADILRSKASMINMTSFETIFEFLGINFRSPDHSTVTNVVAYKCLALDFELWSQTRSEIQRVYFEHFVTLLEVSRYKRFNIKQRFAKMGVVRRLLFVLQTDWYQGESLMWLTGAFKAAMQALWTKDETIKPIVSYLAANLQEDVSNGHSPRSIMSKIDHFGGREKAEKVLELLVQTLSIPAQYNKFATALPVNRIFLLLLGDRPSPFVAKQVLVLIRIGVGSTSSFIRKFELISGWNVFKTVLPLCWDLEVNEAAFDLLLRPYNDKGDHGDNVVVCPQIVPAILSALHSGLNVVARNSSEKGDSVPGTFITEATMELLVERLMNLHASSSTFRQIFQSQQTTQLFVNAYKDFVAKISGNSVLNEYTIRILEKLAHLGLALALDNVVAGAQKREILGILQSAETVLNPAAESTQIDPNLVADTRSVRQRFASARFSLQIGERTVMKIITRIVEWRKTIQVSERKRLRKNILDLRENRRQVSRLYEWTHTLTSERGLWYDDDEKILWRLDETEGPHRIRKKMEPANPKVTTPHVEEQQAMRGVQIPESEVSSAIVQTEVPPWADSYEIASTEIDDPQLIEEITEDKHRKVRHELEPGDVIEAVQTVARISGVDSSPGLLIIGRTHLYMLDGLVEGEDGEVIDAHEAPRQLFFVPGSIVELDGPQRAQRWSHEQVATFSDKTFLFRDVTLEIYFKDSRSLLIVLLDKNKRSDVNHRLSAITARISEVPTPGLLRTPLFGKVSAGARAFSGFWTDQLSTAQRRWQAREISNFTYLSILNQISGRTPSDATQYPIFPWVLQDYQSQILDLTDPKSYRDLSKPMGALTEARREAAETRYSNLLSVGEKPFHYGTHYSSSMIVCHFLIRMAPFTNMFKTLQGGDWDLPDRLFSDVARAYESAARDVRGDVRELIPEFFNCPEFLKNSSNIDFGVQQNTGERIHDVKLPPWARDDPLLFVIMNRRALESTYVSEHLPAWIDLIWGYKQKDPDSLNVFHPLSYEGAIDLDTITDELEREATVGIIHNFGQTPRKLFTTPHPQRYNHGLATLPIGTLHGVEEDFQLLNQGSRCFQDLGPSTAVKHLALDMISEKVVPCPEGVLVVPSHPHEQIEWGTRTGGELRVVVDQKITQVIEGTSCACAAFADSSNLVTGSSDHIVRLWTLTRGHLTGLPLSISVSHTMRVHTDKVISVAASRAWSIAVSGSEDGSAAVWDLNRALYIRSIWHGSEKGGSEDKEKAAAVHLIDINESTGYIATCSKLKLCLHTINAQLIATLDLTTMPSSALYPPITALSFHEREYSHLGVLATASADGTITLRTWTADGTPKGEKAKWEFITMRTMRVRTVTGRSGGRTPAVTALKFLGESLCHGEDSGKSYLWSLPD
ncbi:beach-domain-containing protein [Dendrothele bispora CBS 962.96]|uniref:Beach-domain-containing protein n=1 Tax=Dendrothele bispora (strain CBS 962.96) TaxID=1314807 RepID=A0A4S8MME0_DENBC|nr:beach-domain-containing protein [Dendrothele bispora CBS 962.96]